MFWKMMFSGIILTSGDLRLKNDFLSFAIYWLFLRRCSITDNIFIHIKWDSGHLKILRLLATQYRYAAETPYQIQMQA